MIRTTRWLLNAFARHRPAVHHRIFAKVYTAQHRHATQLQSIHDTWAHHCDGFMAASNFTDPSLNAVNMARLYDENYSNMWQKVRKLETLQRCNEQRIRWTEGGKHRSIWGIKSVTAEMMRRSTGPGYTLNKAALKLLATKGLAEFMPKARKSSEDTLIGRLFRSYNVLPYRTTDAENRHRYHHWPPGRHYLNHEHRFYIRLTQQLNYSWGANYSSLYSVSFHYMDRYEPNQMRRLYALLYGLCDQRNRSNEPAAPGPRVQAVVTNTDAIISDSTTRVSDMQQTKNESKSQEESKSSVVAPADGEQRYINVGCVIYTYHGARELIQESYNTWGQHCNFFQAYSDEDWEYAPGKRTVFLRNPPGAKAWLWNDVKNMWLDLAKRYQNGSLQADYVVFSGDDSFWILPALRKYLATFPPSERLYMGEWMAGL